MRKKIVYVGMYDYCKSGLLVTKDNNGKAVNGLLQIKRFREGGLWGIERWGGTTNFGLQQKYEKIMVT